MSHTKFSNSGHIAVPLELRNSSEVNSHSRILSYPLGTDHAQKTQFYCCVAQKKRSHVIAISPVHWRADCCLATAYKHSSYYCLRVAGCLSSRCLVLRWHVTLSSRKDIYRPRILHCLIAPLCSSAHISLQASRLHLASSVNTRISGKN
jgi:hypothetical protein